MVPMGAVHDLVMERWRVSASPGVLRAFEVTRNTIEAVQWVVVGDRSALGICKGHSEGPVLGRPFVAIGHGTNVFAVIDDRRKIVDEHLSRATNR